MRIQLFLLGLLASGAALAEPDIFGLGTGRNGALAVQQPNTVINQYTQLTANTAAGSRDLTVTSAKLFNVGDLILVHQSTGLLPAPASGDQRTLTLATNPVGRFEYARVEAKGDTSIRVTAPLQYSYAASVSQVVSVPEYTDVQVPAGTSLKAAPWNGSVGGILAFLASGTLTLDGLITADGAGFRGGAFIDHPDLYDCSSLDEPAGNGGSYKGEGPVEGRFGTAAGRGNLATGAGGGVCHNSGGGGGGHAGAGGKGGNSITTTPNNPAIAGGLGGARVSYQPYDHILFGGGGGGGGGHVSAGTNGGAGGGVLLIRAGIVDGTGQFSAKGAPADFVPASVDDGAGGGGAGGAISVRAAHGLKCASANASGGTGGDTHSTNYPSGPGGGGGGGVVFLQGGTIACTVSVVAGYSGQSTQAGGSFGAEPSVVDSGSAYGSDATYLFSYQTPATPVLTLPANGTTGLPVRPRVEGTADPGVLVHIYLDGVQVGLVNTDAAGGFQYNPTADMSPGTHLVQASAEVFGAYSLPSGAHAFQVGTGGDGGVADGGLPDGGLADGGLSGMAPILVVPAEGEGVDPLTLFAGMSPSGASVSIEVDGAELARVSLDDQRRFRYTLTDAQRLAPGTHSAVVHAWDASGTEGLSSVPTGFEVKAPMELEAGCGCDSSQGAGLGAVALLLGLGAARLRRRA